MHRAKWVHSRCTGRVVAAALQPPGRPRDGLVGPALLDGQTPATRGEADS